MVLSTISAAPTSMVTTGDDDAIQDESVDNVDLQSAIQAVVQDETDEANEEDEDEASTEDESSEMQSLAAAEELLRMMAEEQDANDDADAEMPMMTLWCGKESLQTWKEHLQQGEEHLSWSKEHL